MNKLSINRYKTILITGGLGFIGSAFIGLLLKNTDLKIINIDKENYASDHERINNNLKKIKYANDRYVFHKVDLINYDLTKELIFQYKPDFIVHFAAETHVDRSITNPETFLKSNIIGTFNLLNSSLAYWEKLKNDKKDKFRFLHISTDEVFGSLGNSGKFNEKSNYSPRSPYSASKASSDHLVSSWHFTYGLPILITNCGNNYGPWQFPEKLIPLAIAKAIKNEPIPLYGDGKNIRDWIFVDDHADALKNILFKANSGKRYCIGGYEERTNKEVITEICNFMDTLNLKDESFKKNIIFVDDRPGHDYRYSLDSSLLKKDLSWQPKYKFSEGIKKTVSWYLDNPIWITNMELKSHYRRERLGLKN